MTWATAALGDVCDIVSGATPRTSERHFWNGDIFWTTPKDISDLDVPYLARTPRTITEEGLRSCAAAVLPPNSVLLSSRAPIGLVAINSVPMATNQGYKSLVPNTQKVDSKFLFHWLRSKTAYLQGLGNGATFKEISKAVVERIEIPLPPLDEQRRIAVILDEADALRRKRKRSLNLLDSLTQSIFLEMFGDPVSNLKRLNIVKLSSICSKITDGTHDTPQRVAVGVPFITGKNIRPGTIDLSVLEYVDAQTHEEIFRRCNPETGDVLYVNIGAGVGNAAINHLTYPFSMKNVALLKINKNIVSSEYIACLLNIGRVREKILGQNSKGGAQKFLSLSMIRGIEVPLPPFAEAALFSERVRSVQKSIQTMTHSITDLDFVFSSLQHRAFSGEL